RPSAGWANSIDTGCASISSNGSHQGAWPKIISGSMRCLRRRSRNGSGQTHFTRRWHNRCRHRVASKTGQAQARILAMLLMTLRGTPFLFAGDEIGAEQVSIPPERIQDPFEKLIEGFGLCRDPERAPLRWDDTETGGFTTGEPWLPLGEDRSRNIE